MRHALTLVVVALIATACASNQPRAPRSEFDDIPVPRGLTLDADKSVVIESPSVKAARLHYKGRLEPDSVGVAFRTTLEANGWRQISSNAIDAMTSQVYEKPGNSLTVMIYECMLAWYTCVDLRATRTIGGPAQATPGSTPSPVITPLPAIPAAPSGQFPAPNDPAPTPGRTSNLR